MWMALHQAGDIERSWCHHRYKTMRDLLTKEGLLDWEDEGYVVGVADGDGRFVPGKAAKWRASEELMERMDDEQVGQPSIGQFVGVVHEVEEKSILYGCKTTQRPLIPLSSRQPEPLRAVLDRLGIDPPLSRPRFAGYS